MPNLSEVDFRLSYLDSLCTSVSETDDHHIECEIVPKNMKEGVVIKSKHYPGRVTGLVTVKVSVMELFSNLVGNDELDEILYERKSIL